MGLGEGVTLPCIHIAVSRWVPVQERTRGVAFVTSGQLVGTVLALASSPAMARDWAMMFYLFGALGFAWAGLAFFFFFSSPEVHPGISRAERLYIARNRAAIQASSADEKDKKGPLPGPYSWTSSALFGVCCAEDPSPPCALPPWYRLVVQKPMLAAMAALIAHNWGWYVLLGWMPRYLVSLGASESESRIYLVLDFLFVCVCACVCVRVYVCVGVSIV